ncbi:MAG: signal recognition particle-docking protein FtsY [Halobacteriales archaeon]
MFDGLRDRLGGFTEDAEEAIDEAEDVQDAEDGPEVQEDAAEADEREREATEGGGEGQDEDDDSGVAAGIGSKARTLVGERAFVIDEDALERPLEELELQLLALDVEVEVAREIVDGVRDNLLGGKRHWRESKHGLVMDALRDALVEVIDVDGLDLLDHVEDADEPVVVVFTGVNGVGKTTSIAKIAHLLDREGYTSVIANGDTYRAGANQQIQEHAEAVDVKLIKHEQGGDPAAVIYDAVEYAEANDVDVVLGDTAGRLHTSDDLMNQLRKIDRVVDPDLTVFVDEAVAGQDAVRRAREFDAAAEIDGVVLTKADADSGGGAAVSIAHVTGSPILYLGVGQAYDDLVEFDAMEFVDSLLDEDEE